MSTTLRGFLCRLTLSATMLASAGLMSRQATGPFVEVAFAEDSEADDTVQMSAKKLPKGTRAKAKGPVRSTVKAAAPVPGQFNPLFPAPAVLPLWMAGDFVGRDPNLAATMDFSAQAAATRAQQIRQAEADLRLQQPTAPQAQQVGANLVKLYEEQSLYLENLRGNGMTDKSYPDINHFIKANRSNLVAQLDALLKRFPNSELRARWKATSLISRIKIGDPTVRAEALKFVKAQRNADSNRVMMVGLAWDLMAGKPRSEYGSVDEAIDATNDPGTKSAFRLFAAEQYATKRDNARAFSLFEDAAKDAQNLRRPDGSLSMLSQRAVARMVQLAIANDPENVDSERVSTLQSFGALDAARYYVEQIALRNVVRQPQRAMRNYADILGLGDTDTALATKIEFRVLDIALNAKDLASAESQWQRVAKLSGGMTAPGVEPRVNTTQTLAWGEVEKRPVGETVDRFVRFHDFFAPAVASYGANDQWALRSVDALARIKRHPDVAARGDALATRSKNSGVQVAALRFSARAREFMLGITSEPAFVRGKRLAQGPEVSNAYVATLDKLSPLVPGAEAERGSFQAAYITHIAGGDQVARTRFEDVLNRYSRGKYAPEAVSYLLDVYQSGRDWVSTEKIARLAEAKRIVPARKQHQDLRAIVEVAVFEQANGLAAANQFEPAAAKYVAFQREFPKSKNGPVALTLAVKNYLAAKKTDLAITQMESLLAQYPTSPFAKETRWQAAEQSKGIGQMLRAANHYEAFAKTYRPEGQQRQAWYKAAEMHKGLGRYANAITDFEIYLKETSSKSEKIKVAKDVADMQMKFGKSTEALAAYDRIMQLSKSQDDEIYARSQMIELYQRMSQEHNARKQIDRVLALKPTNQEGIKMVAKAKFLLARMDARDVRELDPMSERNLRQAVQNLVGRYDRTKGYYLASCEVPGLEYCSVGYYETARLAEDVAKRLLEVELPPTLDPKEVAPIRALVSQHSDRLANESKAFAQQAEQALSSGAPDADMADRIRAYAQQQRGETGGDAPLK